MDLKTAQQLQTQLLDLCPLRDSKDLLAKWADLDNMVSQARLTVDQLKLIHLNTKKALVQKIKKFRNSITLLEKQDLTISDLRSLKTQNRELAPGLSIPVIEVPSENWIPDTPLYYIQSSGEWGIKVAGQVISGSIGDIREGSKKHIECASSKCHCPRRHAGQGYDWLPSHFVHAKKPLCPKNVNMRHFGSRSTLKADIMKSSTKDVHLRNKQLAHDLLVMLLANKLKRSEN